MLKLVGRRQLVLIGGLLGHVLCHGHSHNSHNHSDHGYEKSGGLGAILKKMMDKYGLDTIQKVQFSIAIISSPSLIALALFVALKILRIKLDSNSLILRLMVLASASCLVGDALFDIVAEFPHSNKVENCEIKYGIFCGVMKRIQWWVFCLGICCFWAIDRILQILSCKEKVLMLLDKVEKRYGGQSKSLLANPRIIKSLPFLTVDLLHNFMDGISIASTFISNTKMGISVTTAIFIHEIAHQIGDFSLLMSRNFSLTQAFILQILTSVTAFSGGYFFFIPYFRQKFESVEKYSSCFVAGGFFYQGLCQILGEIKSDHSVKKWSDLFTIALEFAALVFGFLIIEFV